MTQKKEEQKPEETKTEAVPHPRLKLNIYQRKAEVMKVVTYLQREEKKTGLDFRPVSREAVVSKIRDALIEWGIDFQIMTIDANEAKSVEIVGRTGSRTGFLQTVKVRCRLTNVDDPKDRIEAEAVGAGFDKEDKFASKAVTFAEKQAILKAFLIPAGDEADDDSGDGEGEGTGQRKNLPPAKVVAEQVTQIKSLLVQAEFDEKKLLAMLKVPTLEEIPSTGFDEVVGALRKRIDLIAEKKKKEVV
jgi:ribosomal protein S28E/S33